MTNFHTTQKIEVEGIEIEKVKIFLSQPIALRRPNSNEAQIRIQAWWAVFGKYKEILQNKEIPNCLKRKL